MTAVRCPHKGASVHRATIVESATGKRLRSYCNDCGQFVETNPRINRATGEVSHTGWMAVTGQQSGPALDV